MSDHDMFDDLEFENEITEMGDDQPRLLRFVATQQFKTSKILVDHSKRINSLENKNKKVMGFVGGASAVFATAVTATLNYFLGRG